MCTLWSSKFVFVFQPDKMEVPRQKRKYEKKQKVLPLSSGAPHHQGPAVFNAKDLNQYDFPSSDDEPFSQVPAAHTEPASSPQWRILAFIGMGSNPEPPVHSCIQPHQKQRRRTTQTASTPFVGKQAASTML